MLEVDPENNVEMVELQLHLRADTIVAVAWVLAAMTMICWFQIFEVSNPVLG